MEQPSNYPLLSYRYNALGQLNESMTPHSEYIRLGKTEEARQNAYQQLFKYHIAESGLSEIRDATNKAWALGNDYFKQRIQTQLARRVSQVSKGEIENQKNLRSMESDPIDF